MPLQVQCPQINYSCTLIFTSIRTTKTLGLGGTYILKEYRCHLFSSHISFLMADANAIYLSPKPYYLLLINTLRIILSSLLFTTHRLSLFLFLFSFWFSSHISFFHG